MAQLLELINEQKEAFKEVEKLIANYKRDGNDRKSKSQYFLRKIHTLEELWDPVKERHEILLTMVTADQPYFSENTYTKMLEIYEKYIQEWNQKYTEKGGPPMSVGETSQNGSSSTVQTPQNILDMQTTTRNQPKTILNINHNELINLIIDINRILETASTGYLRTHLDLIKHTWHEFRKYYVESQLKSEEVNINFNEVQQVYLEACGKLTDRIQAIENNKNEAINLPKLRLPEFNGTSTAWYTFISLFNKMVHDKIIDDGTKMEYLKTCIKGNTSKVIAHVDPTAENYHVCYNLLVNRYDNKREVLGKLIDSMLRLPIMKTENSAQLRTMHDTVHECVMAIQNMKIHVKV